MTDKELLNELLLMYKILSEREFDAWNAGLNDVEGAIIACKDIINKILRLKYKNKKTKGNS